MILRGGEALSTEDVLLVDGLFFDVAPVPARCTAIRAPRSRRPGSVVLTQSEARRLFGTDERGRPDADHDLARPRRSIIRVTGVVRDLPRNSHVRFTIVARIDPVSYYRRAARTS